MAERCLCLNLLVSKTRIKVVFLLDFNFCFLYCFNVLLVCMCTMLYCIPTPGMWIKNVIIVTGITSKIWQPLFLLTFYISHVVNTWVSLIWHFIFVPNLFFIILWHAQVPVVEEFKFVSVASTPNLCQTPSSSRNIPLVHYKSLLATPNGILTYIL